MSGVGRWFGLRFTRRPQRDESVVKARKDVGPLREALVALQVRAAPWRGAGSGADAVWVRRRGTVKWGLPRTTRRLCWRRCAPRCGRCCVARSMQPCRPARAQAATAVVSAETFEKLLTQSPQSESLATQFVAAVRTATRALEDALEMINARERKIVDEADNLLAELQMRSEEILAANKRAGDPDDSASTACKRAADKVARASGLQEAAQTGEGGGLYAAAVKSAAEAVRAAEDALAERQAVEGKRRRASLAAKLATANAELATAGAKLAVLEERNRTEKHPPNDEPTRDIEDAAAALAKAIALGKAVGSDATSFDLSRRFIDAAQAAVGGVRKAEKSMAARAQAMRDAARANIASLMGAGVANLANARSELVRLQAHKMKGTPGVASAMADAAAAIAAADKLHTAALEDPENEDAAKAFSDAVKAAQAAVARAADSASAAESAANAEARGLAEAENRRVSGLVAAARGRLARARVTQDDLVARNRAARTPHDDVTEAIEAAGQAVMSAEATLKLVDGTPDSVYLGKQFVDAVETAVPLVEAAATALAERERRVAKEESAAREQLDAEVGDARKRYLATKEPLAACKAAAKACDGDGSDTAVELVRAVNTAVDAHADTTTLYNMNLAKPRSADIAHNFVASVPTLEAALAAAKEATSRRTRAVERNKRAEMFATMAAGNAALDGLREKMRTLVAANEAAGAPPDKATQAIADAGGAVAKAVAASEASEAASNPNSMIENLAEAVEVAKAAVANAVAELKKREAKKVAGSRWVRAGKIAAAMATLENCRKKLDSFRAPLLPDGRPDPSVTKEIEKAAVAVRMAEEAQRTMQAKKSSEHVDAFLLAVPKARKAVLRALASSRAGNVLADRQRAADKARLVVDVADAKKRLAIATGVNNDLKARNRKAGSPPDSATGLLDASNSAVMTSEVLADMIKTDDDALKMGGRLLEAVTATEAAVEKARKALGEREARDLAKAHDALIKKTREASATLKGLPARLAPLQAALGRAAKAPPADVTRKIEAAVGAVAGSESVRAALYALPEMPPALAAVSDADGGEDGDDGIALSAEAITLSAPTIERIKEYLANVPRAVKAVDDAESATAAYDGETAKLMLQEALTKCRAARTEIRALTDRMAKIKSRHGVLVEGAIAATSAGGRGPAFRAETTPGAPKIAAADKALITTSALGDLHDADAGNGDLAARFLGGMPSARAAVEAADEAVTQEVERERRWEPVGRALGQLAGQRPRLTAISREFKELDVADAGVAGDIEAAELELRTAEELQAQVAAVAGPTPANGIAFDVPAELADSFVSKAERAKLAVDRAEAALRALRQGREAVGSILERENKEGRQKLDAATKALNKIEARLEKDNKKHTDKRFSPDTRKAIDAAEVAISAGRNGVKEGSTLHQGLGLIKDAAKLQAAADAFHQQLDRIGELVTAADRAINFVIARRAEDDFHITAMNQQETLAARRLKKARDELDACGACSCVWGGERGGV